MKVASLTPEAKEAARERLCRRPGATRPGAGYNASMSDKKHTPQRSEPPRDSQRATRNASSGRIVESAKSIQRGSERYSEALQRLAKR